MLKDLFQIVHKKSARNSIIALTKSDIITTIDIKAIEDLCTNYFGSLYSAIQQGKLEQKGKFEILDPIYTKISQCDIQKLNKSIIDYEFHVVASEIQKDKVPHVNVTDIYTYLNKKY